MKATSWPETIISSLMVTIRPRRLAGAISARNSGTTAEAAPTARPSTIRDAIIGTSEGASGGADGSAEEQGGADHQAALAAESVGEAAADQRAEGGADQQRADDEALPAGGQVEVVAHVEQRAGDDAGVVAEEQPAQRRDDRDPQQEAPGRGGLGRGGGAGRAVETAAALFTGGRWC